MPKYLGEAPVDIRKSPYKDYTPTDWAMYFLERYGHIDGDHHKTWVLDQMARIIKGTPVIVKLAKWKDGQEEYRINTGEPSKKYKDWVIEMCDGEDGPDTYGYDEGIAP